MTKNLIFLLNALESFTLIVLCTCFSLMYIILSQISSCDQFGIIIQGQQSFTYTLDC